MKKAFITGAGGFIGSHLTDALIQQGWDVTAMIKYHGNSSWGWLEPHRLRPPANLKVVAGDLTDPFRVREAAAGAEVIFHLGALIAIPYSYLAPAAYVQTNVLGTLNVAEAALLWGARKFIHTSTSEVYGTANYTPIDEKHPLQAQSPYAASKIGADKLVESFALSRGLPAVTVRPFNTFGPRQSARAVIPSIITQALPGGPVKLGTLEAVRDLTFVTDTVAGFLRAAEADVAAGQVFNLGTNRGVTIGELAKLIFHLLQVNPEIIHDASRVRPAKSEVFELISDHAKATRELGWQPQVTLEAGLQRTIEWIKLNPGHYRPDEYAL